MCDDAHELFGGLANGDLQVGELADWLHVQGKVAWWVYGGSYDGLPDAWSKFSDLLHQTDLQFTGPPGDVYVCAPVDHEESPETMLTILWAPVQ